MLSKTKRILAEDDDLPMGVKDSDSGEDSNTPPVNTGKDYRTNNNSMTRELLMNFILVGNPNFDFNRKLTFDEHGQELYQAVMKSYAIINKNFDEAIKTEHGAEIEEAKEKLYSKSMNVIRKNASLQVTGGTDAENQLLSITPSKLITDMKEMTFENFYKNNGELEDILDLSDELNDDVFKSTITLFRINNVDQDKIDKFSELINYLKNPVSFKNIITNGKNLVDFFMNYEGITVDSGEQSIDPSNKKIYLSELIENSNEIMSSNEFVEKINADSFALDRIKNELSQLLQQKISTNSVQKLHEFFKEKKKILKENIIYQHLIKKTKIQNSKELLSRDNMFEDLEEQNKKLNNIIQRMVIGNKGYNKVTSMAIDRELDNLWDLDLNDPASIKKIKQKIIWFSQQGGAEKTEFFKELMPWNAEDATQLTLRGDNIEKLIRIYQQTKKIFTGKINFPIGYQFMIHDNSVHLVLKIDKVVYNSILKQRDDSKIIQDWFGSADLIRQSLHELGFDLVRYNSNVSTHGSDSTGLYAAIKDIMSLNSIDNISNAFDLDKIKKIKDIFIKNQEIKKSQLHININTSLFTSYTKKENLFSATNGQKLSFVYMQEDEQMANDFFSLFNVDDIDSLRKKILDQEIPDNISLDFENFKIFVDVFIKLAEENENKYKQTPKQKRVDNNQKMTHQTSNDAQKTIDADEQKDSMLKKNYENLIKNSK